MGHLFLLWWAWKKSIVSIILQCFEAKRRKNSLNEIFLDEYKCIIIIFFIMNVDRHCDHVSMLLFFLQNLNMCWSLKYQA